MKIVENPPNKPGSRIFLRDWRIVAPWHGGTLPMIPYRHNIVESLVFPGQLSGAGLTQVTKIYPHSFPQIVIFCPFPCLKNHQFYHK